MDSDEPNLSVVAPARRDEVRRRIKVLRGYLAAPSVKAANAAADELGLSLSSFYNLVRAWKSGKPEQLPGAGRPRERKNELNEAQRQLISNVAAQKPTLVLERAFEMVEKLGGERGVPLPSPSTIRNHLSKAMGPRIAENSFAKLSTFAIDHVAVDLPVEDNAAHIMPIAAIVLRVSDGTILGVNLTLDGPSPTSVATAVIAAASTLASASSSETLALEIFNAPGWEPLVADLSRLPLELRLHQRDTVGRSGPASTLLPKRLGGIAIRPRLVSRSRGERRASVGVGTDALTLDQANILIRARWMPPR